MPGVLGSSKEKEPTSYKKELEEMRKTYTIFKDDMHDDIENNNYQDRFAIIIERPRSFILLTLILGLIAFLSALYIGFITPFETIPVHIMGFIIGLWGIRDILLGGTRISPSYFEYVILVMIVILFSGIIFRAIWGKREKGKNSAMP
jgi:hypothetical protein